MGAGETPKDTIAGVGELAFEFFERRAERKGGMDCAGRFEDADSEEGFVGRERRERRGERRKRLFFLQERWLRQPLLDQPHGAGGDKEHVVFDGDFDLLQLKNQGKRLGKKEGIGRMVILWRRKFVAKNLGRIERTRRGEDERIILLGGILDGLLDGVDGFGFGFFQWVDFDFTDTVVGRSGEESGGAFAVDTFEEGRRIGERNTREKVESIKRGERSESSEAGRERVGKEFVAESWQKRDRAAESVVGMEDCGRDVRRGGSLQEALDGGGRGWGWVFEAGGDIPGECFGEKREVERGKRLEEVAKKRKAIQRGREGGFGVVREEEREKLGGRLSED